MAKNHKRNWDGDDWEDFSRRLVQMRHGPENVQDVPSKVKGDAGIDFFTTDGCCYQSYAPQETVDTAKAASAMKQKATHDLPKLIKNADVITNLLGTIKIRRWILLCPFLDDKDVIVHVSSKSLSVIEANLDFINPDFCGLVHCLVDFESQLDTLRQQSLGVPISINDPTDEAITKAFNAIDERLEGKLKRGFPEDEIERRFHRKRQFIRSHLISSNVLDQLKLDFPDLWERARRTVQAEELRLETIGAGPGVPKEQLERGLERLEERLSKELNSLDESTITSIANGTLGTWLIECPLDFAEVTN